MKAPRLLVVLALALATGAFSGCSKHSQYRRAMSSANADFAAGRYDRAEIGYMKARQYAPMDPAAIRQLGLIYSYEGRTRLALGYLLKSVELEPTRSDVRLKLAQSWVDARQWQNARQQVLWVLGTDPTNEAALYLLVDAITSSNEWAESSQMLANLRTQNPDAAGFHLAAGWMAVRTKEFDRAGQEFQAALKLNPNSSLAHAAQGRLNWARGELEPAGQNLKAAVALAPSDSDVLLSYAEFLGKTQSRDAARKVLEDATQKAPFMLPALNALAEMAFFDKRFEDCRGLVDRIRQTDQENYAAWVLSGHLYLALHDAPKAVAEFEKMVVSTAFGSEPQFIYELALAQTANDDPVAASASLHDALTKDTNYLAAATLLAELKIRGGEPAAAVTLLTRFVKKYPQNQNLYKMLGRAYLAAKNPDEALAVYRQAQTLFPDDPEAPVLVGNILAARGDIAAARRSFEKAMSVSPGYAPALDHLVTLDLRDHNASVAEARVKAELEEHRSNASLARLHALLAAIYRSNKDYDRAITELKKAIEIDPQADTSYLALSEVYVAANRQQEALKGLDDLLARTNDVAAVMQKGRICDIMKDYPAARDAYEKVLTIDPKFSAALNNLAYIYAVRIVNLDRANDLAQQARNLDPADPGTADTLGWILFKRGDYPRALSLLSESAENMPDVAEVQYHLGMANYMLGEEVPARDALTRAAGAADDFPGKEEIGPRLELLRIDPATATPAQVAKLEQARTERPDDPILLLRLAAIRERDGAADKAIPIYEGLLARFPRNVFVLSHLAKLEAASDPAKAMDLAKTAQKLAPDNPQISRSLAQLIFQSGQDYKYALSLYQAAASAFSADPDFQYELGWAYYYAGQSGPAVAAMRQAIESGLAAPKNAEAGRFIKLVSISDDPGQPGAADVVRQELAAHPDYLPAKMASASVREKQGDYSGARDIYEAILAQNPLLVSAARRLAILYADALNSSDPTKAYQTAKTASEAFPDDPDVVKALGVLAFKAGENSRAANALSGYARNHPGDKLALYYLGKAQYNLKRNRESKVALQQALALDLPSDLDQDARKILDQIQ